MPIYFRKTYKFIKTVHKNSSYNSLIYKILHVKSSFFFFFFFLQKGFSKQSDSSAFFTPAVPDEGQLPVHNLHLKGGPTTRGALPSKDNSYKGYSPPKFTCNAMFAQ